MLPVEEARERIAARTKRIDTVSIDVPQAHGRTLAKDARAPIAIPRWDNSAMDGYAVRTDELPGQLPVTTTIAAGDAPGYSLAPGTSCKVMTGAPVPSGANAIVMREDVVEEDGVARFAQRPKPGQHIRRQGEDIGEGAVAVRAGTRLGGGELGVLAALGIPRVDVSRRPRVALVATGTELVRLGGDLRPGQKVNSNSIALTSEVHSAGAEVTSDAIAGDDKETLRDCMANALAASDVLITMGGVSAGDFDFVRDVCPEVGIDIDFYKVAMKPGKPLVFGVAGDEKLFFGLPGNPVSTMVVFELFVRPALLEMSHRRHIDRPRVPVRLAAPYEKKAGRAHYLRASLRRTGQRLVADVGRKQGSGMLSSMVDVDALIEIPEETTRVECEDDVSALLLAPV